MIDFVYVEVVTAIIITVFVLAFAHMLTKNKKTNVNYYISNMIGAIVVAWLIFSITKPYLREEHARYYADDYLLKIQFYKTLHEHNRELYNNIKDKYINIVAKNSSKATSEARELLTQYINNNLIYCDDELVFEYYQYTMSVLDMFKRVNTSAGFRYYHANITSGDAVDNSQFFTKEDLARHSDLLSRIIISISGKQKHNIDLRQHDIDMAMIISRLYDKYGKNVLVLLEGNVSGEDDEKKAFLAVYDLYVEIGKLPRNRVENIIRIMNATSSDN